MGPALGWAESKMGPSLCHSKTPLSLGDSCRWWCRVFAWRHSLRQRMWGALGAGPAGEAASAVVRSCAARDEAAGTRKRGTVAVTQPGERVTDFTGSVPRTPLNIPMSGR